MPSIIFNEAHLSQFQADGYTILSGLIDQARIDCWKETFHSLISELEPIRRPSQHGLGEQIVIDNLVEHATEVMLPAVTEPPILDFLELVMGPFVQLESLRVNLTHPSAPEALQVETRNWHRDMWALSVERTKDYLPPNACNALTYFQDMNDLIGPLRVLPGSHRRPNSVKNLFEAQPDERLIYAQAGDVVIIHSALVHAATPNISGQPRYFMSRFYNKSYLPHRDSHTGPQVQRIITKAQRANDRRLMRLFGVDDLLFSRQVDASQSEAELWQRWTEQDRNTKKLA